MNIELLIIDEYSMLSQIMLAKIDLRLQQAKSKNISFGGISVVLIGDPRQLLPVGGSSLYCQKHKTKKALDGFAAYKNFNLVVMLEAVMRQTNDENDPEQAQFMKLIPRLRNGESTLDDYNLLLKRIQTAFNSESFSNATRIFNDNESVDDYNMERLIAINRPITQIFCENSNSKSKSGSAADFGGLANFIHLSIGCNVTLTLNTWNKKGLVNGAFGTIKDIIYPDIEFTNNTLPETIIIHFPKYDGPQFFHAENKHNWIPINAKNMYSKRTNSSRTQYPLRLAYAITTHKVQGETLLSGVVNLGESEKSLGQTFVQIFRFKKLSQFLIQPFAFDRLLKIAKSESLAPRLKEEKNLKTLFDKTVLDYAHLLPR